MAKQQILFVINPISGNGKPINWVSLIKTHLDTSKFDYQIQFTKVKGDGMHISADATHKKVDIVCAVGGDGTINEVAQGLINSTTALAILPRGSGNGLARHFNIPLSPTEALEKLNHGQAHQMDVGYLNKRLFLCAAGIGFDAAVAQAFDQFGKRGFLSYAWLSIKQFLSYQSQDYNISIDHKPIHTHAFLIAFSNASQFGNNAYIAPDAQTDDGLLNLVIIKPFPLWATPGLLHKVFTKRIHLSKYCESHTFKSLSLMSANKLAHIDGEPLLQEEAIHVSIHSGSLKIVY